MAAVPIKHLVPQRYLRQSAFRLAPLWTLLTAVVMAVGCSHQPVSHVAGKITYQGTPVDHGVINFIGGDNEPRGGPIAVDGTYACDLPQGSYTVTIAAPAVPPVGWVEGQPLPELGGGVPEKYNMRQTSGLTAEIAEPQQTVNFDLE